jgi:oligoribonuclease (3'-5' exoribonuclease)
MATKLAIPKFGLAIDWETSGYSLPDYAAKHQGISFGAVVFDLSSLTCVDELYCEVKFNPKYQWSDEAERIHGLSRDYLEKNGVTQEDAALQLGSLVLKYFGDGKVMLLGHRVWFDESFTNQLMDVANLQLTYDPIRLDSAAVGVLFLEMQRSDDIFDAMGLPKRAAHNALEDVIYTIEAIRKIKAIFLKGLEA